LRGNCSGASQFCAQELEALEDELDGAEAKRRMVSSDPAERKTLDDLRFATGRAVKVKDAIETIEADGCNECEP